MHDAPAEIDVTWVGLGDAPGGPARLRVVAHAGGDVRRGSGDAWEILGEVGTGESTGRS